MFRFKVAKMNWKKKKNWHKIRKCSRNQILIFDIMVPSTWQQIFFRDLFKFHWRSVAGCSTFWFFFFEIFNFDMAFSKALKVPFIWDIRRYPYVSDNILDALKFQWRKILIKIHWKNNSCSCCFQMFMIGIIHRTSTVKLQNIFTRLQQ